MMFSAETLNQVKEFTSSATASASDMSGTFESIRQYILLNFGEHALIATYITVAAVVLFIFSRLAKITFSAAKYLAVPALVLAFVGSFFTPYSFVSLLPVTAAGCSLLLLFKG